MLARGAAWCLAHGAETWDSRRRTVTRSRRCAKGSTSCACLAATAPSCARPGRSVGRGVFVLAWSWAASVSWPRSSPMGWSAHSTRSQPATSPSTSDSNRGHRGPRRRSGARNPPVPERGGRARRPGAHDPGRGRQIAAAYLATYVADAVRWSPRPPAQPRTSAPAARSGPAAAQHDHHLVAASPHLPAQRCCLRGAWPSLASLRSAGSGAVVSIDGQWDHALSTG